jgi:hypothetical protein
MTSWPEQPAQGQPPQTRRQARENERTAARQDARRADTAEPSPAGEIPAGAFAEPGVLPPSRPHEPNDSDFDSLVFTAPGASAPTGASVDFIAPGAVGTGDHDDPASPFFRHAADPSRPQAVTQPLAVVSSAEEAPKAVAGSTDSGIVPERTLTRREMRAMMQAHEANQQANHAPHPAEPVAPVTFARESAGVEAPPEAGAAAAATAETAPSDETKTAWPFAPLTPSAEKPAPIPSFSPTPAAPPVETSAPTSPFASLGFAAPSSPDTTAQERRPFTPPTGHWSTAAEVEQDSEPIISRNVGQSTAATTTNALILPAIPRPDATAPLTSTGEILVTGSIDLPRGVGSTGLDPEHLDSSDIDNLLDGEENEFNTSEVAPVRASRAISTHTSTRGVIAPPKKRGNALPTVLMITAGVLAVGVIGLLVAAYWLKVF